PPHPAGVPGGGQADGPKISKSAGNVVRPDELIDRFGSDGVRYFLLREMVFGQDASFSDEGFVDRYNSDLANDLSDNRQNAPLATARGTPASGRVPLPHTPSGAPPPPEEGGGEPLAAV